MNTAPIAHRRKFDGEEQNMPEHLRGVAQSTNLNAQKLGLGLAGELIGLLHDLGKYSHNFQQYLRSAVQLIDQDCDDYVDSVALKGKIDHSTAGAQYIWNKLSQRGEREKFVAQLLSLCVASHHSGLIDCISADFKTFGEDIFRRRMAKSSEKTHLNEVLQAVDREILFRAEELFSNEDLLNDVQSLIRNIIHFNEKSRTCMHQQLGLMVRFLFSCLIDADRTDTADFEYGYTNTKRQYGIYTEWPTLTDRLESHINQLEKRTFIDEFRRNISQQCLAAAAKPKGIYTLTVPTGGGKTLASLRFALNHAKQRGLDRIVYVIPFTSIIDQNAEVVRKILETSPAEHGRIVLEHHSNLTPEQQTWKEKILSENWDAPVVFTTMVQFLESLFGKRTRGARRMHQLANAVLIFDEIQTLPIKCVHLFNNAINFLVEQANSSVVLCTATQPLLDRVSCEHGAIRLSPEHKIIEDVHTLFDDLKRVEVRDCRKPGGWSYEEVANLALKETRTQGSCLVIVNTKDSARKVYQLCSELDVDERIHLSTGMCPAHRKQKLDVIRKRLDQKLPILCVSTQLIEAGVDVDFRVVVRFLAGLDSIAQAAGRCNRNGQPEPGIVYIVDPAEENLKNLPDITKAAKVGQRVLDDFKFSKEIYHGNLFGPDAMNAYYRYYFFDRKEDMSYPLSVEKFQYDDTILNLLSKNSKAVAEHQRQNGINFSLHFQQSFMTAANAFESIDGATRGIIVPCGEEGEALINELCATFDVQKQYDLLRRAQQFTVNVFPHVLQELVNKSAVHPIQKDVDILYLDKRYYSSEYGLNMESISNMETMSA